MKQTVKILVAAALAVSAAAQGGARWDEGAPRINGPKAYGATPGRAFLYAFPTCGSRDGLKFSVSGGSLPPGVSLDAKLGVLSGKVEKAGEYQFEVSAVNAHGSARKRFSLVIGDRRALTPPMGWTSWNAFTSDVDQELMETTAEALVKKGLAAHGYVYVNVDSCWQGQRNATNTAALQPNEKFPDMGGMVKKIHSLGLKAGIYSTPMVHAWGSRRERLLLGSTDYPLDPDYFHPHFGGCGKKGYEKEDALQFADWGFDWLKYDWSRTEPHHTRIMREALDATGRDFVLQVCTGAKLSNVQEFAACCELARGNSDTRDVWKSLTEKVMRRADGWLPHVRPGFWYDLDMLAVGAMRIDRKESVVHAPRPGQALPKEMNNKLTHDEIASHFAWWALIPAPLFLSCDIEHIDDFTLSLVTNDDLIEINQDYPAKPATFEDVDGGKRRIWRRELSDGRRVLAFFNLTDDGEWQVSHPLGGAFAVRDVFAGADMGTLDRIEASLPVHAAKVYLLGTAE